LPSDRPINDTVREKHEREFPQIDLFPVTTVASGWNEAQEKFFAEGGVFDGIYKAGR
jgi:sulfate transport system substrate-binding protein